MRALMIVTYFNSQLWKELAWPDSPHQEIPMKHKSVDDDEVLILCQAESEEDREDRAMIESRQKTTDWLIQLANSANYKESQVYIATHAGYTDFSRLAPEVLNERFKTGADYNHERGHPLFDALVDLLDKGDTSSFEAVLDRIERLRKLTYAQRLSTLKHRLAHVFLPVSVDLHAWHEFGYDDLYLQEIRDGYRFDEGRLDRARSLLYQESSVSDNIETIIAETKLYNDESWLAVKCLLPPKSREQAIEGETSDAYELFKGAKAVLESLKDRDKLVELRTELRKENVFGAWCKDLDNHLSQLVGKVDH